MKKPKSKSFIFKVGVLVVAFALLVLCFPVNAILALAEDFSMVDLTYMTISSDATAGAITKVVNRGATYTIPKALIGGKILIDGKTGISGDSSNTPNENLVSSSVKVQYGGVGADLLNEDKTSFAAERVGTYVVTYSYTYKSDAKTQYTNTYQLKVECVLSSAAFNFVDNTAVMPSIIDLSLTGAEVAGDHAANVTENREESNQGEKTYRDVEIALPEVKDENGEIVKDVKFVTSIPQDSTTEKFVLISVNGGTNVPSKGEEQEKLAVHEKEGKFYLDGDDFKDDRFGAGKYTIKYAYYIRNKAGDSLGAAQFVTSTTKEIQVYSKNDPHYEKYTLELQLASDWVDNGETGVEKTLPKAKGVTSSTSSPANEEVEVSYKVEVQYHAKDGVYGALNEEKYNASEKDADAEGGFKKIVDVQDEKTYLVDPTAFKPLDDGSYRFIYTITDFYGNTVTSSSGAYEYLNIIDEQDPTPIVYDASVTRAEGEKLEDESYKLKTNAPSNGVIVYAIGIDDNVSGAEDSTLQREIRTSESVSKYTITDYNDKNLVFNYRKTSNDAWQNLLTNNYLLRKDVEAYNNEHTSQEIDTDAEMLTYLKEHNYLIVVDKANVGHIYGLFAEQIKAAKTEITDGEVPDGESDTNGNKKAANFLKWLQDKYSDTKTDDSKKSDTELAADKKEITDLGFAYIDSDQTFGATSADGGMGATTYYIHYIATDKQGNKADKSYEMNIGGETSTDGERPEIKFGTTLQDSYNPDLTITFDVPTATDNSSDKNMKVRTFYRFLSADGKEVTTDREGNELVKGGTYEKLDNVFAELKEDAGATADEKALANEFKPYHTGTKVGYIELKDADAGKYSIDLSKVATTAAQLQIFAYTYDDAGNVGLYGETIKINNATDSIAPQHVENAQDYTKTVEQGETVEIPEVMVYDDNVAYMNYEVKVHYYGKDGLVEIPTSGATSIRKNLGNGAGEYHVYGGKFIASFEGKYAVSVTLNDSRNNSVTYFFNYEAKGKVVVKQPSISATLAKNQTIELDGDANYDPKKGIAIPTPTVNYDIPNSVTYDEYTAVGYVEDTADAPSDLYVVRGVDKNGKATNWSTEGQEGSFKPTEIGTKQIQYTVNLEVYNRKMFAYKDLAYSSSHNQYVGGYFVKAADKANESPNLTITPISENEIVVNEGGYYLIVRELNPNWVAGGVAEKYVYNVFDYSGKVKGSQITNDQNKPDCMKDSKEATTWFGEIMAYSLQSDVYTINVKDTIGPKIKELESLYTDNQYTVDEFKELVGNPSDNNSVDDKKGLQVLGIEATDASGIDWEKSEIVLSWKLANGVSSSHTYKGADVVTKTNLFKPISANLTDGTYTVTYTVYDKNGNSSVATYTIARVGDVVQPTIEVKQGLVQSSYQVGQGTKLRIDPTKDLTFKDNITSAEDLAKTLKITLTNTAGEVKPNQELLDSEGVYEFTLDELGSYTLTIEIEDAVGNNALPKTFTFDVVAQETQATNVYQTVGTVLIVISVLVLAGVIIYFIVSKVRLDKELKK